VAVLGFCFAFESFTDSSVETLGLAAFGFGFDFDLFLVVRLARETSS
jgi:hypothetical protein